MKNNFFLVNPHKSRTLSTKLKGFTEYIWENVDIVIDDNNSFFSKEKRLLQKWIIDNNLLAKEIFSLKDLKRKNNFKIFIDSRQKISNHLKEIIKEKASRIITSGNHYISVKEEYLNFLKELESTKRLFDFFILLENIYSKEFLCERWGINPICYKFLVLAPIIESKFDFERFKLGSLYEKESIKKRQFKYLHAGSISKRAPNSKTWWMNRFNVNNLYPGRVVTNQYSKKLGICDISSILWDLSNETFWDKIARKIKNKIIPITKSKVFKEYYSKDLGKYFSESIFFICPEDIMGVVPQLCFQGMRTGLIIIGSSSEAYKSLGFENEKNYISVGNNWNEESLTKVIKLCNKINPEKILELRKNSLSLYLRIENDAKNTIENSKK